MTDTSAPLRRDVRLFGDTLGRILVEQEGRALLAEVERIRLLARRARDAGRRDEWPGPMRALEPARQARVVRAFALYFQLANLAEQHHRLRRGASLSAQPAPPRESLEDAFARLGAAGVDDQQLRSLAAGVSLELVLTAHPTEASRRGTLAAQQRRSSPLDDRAARRAGRTRRSPRRSRSSGRATRFARDRPRVVDEIRQGLWFFEVSLLDAADEVLAEYRRRLPNAPTPLRFGTWIGGDQDGNPAAGPDTAAEALERARVLALERYRTEVRELARSLAVSSRLVAVSDELVASLARDEEELPGYLAEIGRQNLDEPYRRKLSFVWRRLRNTLGCAPEPGYASAASCWPISTCWTGASARTAAGGSPTDGSPHCAAGSRCSASTSRSSTSASTPATSASRGSRETLAEAGAAARPPRAASARHARSSRARGRPRT